MTLLGTKHIHTTSYHPMSNGLVERFHRLLKSALKPQQYPEYWTDALPLVLLGIHATIKEDISCTTAELLYGTTLRLPGEFFPPSLQTDVDPGHYVNKLKSTISCNTTTNTCTAASVYQSKPFIVITCICTT